MTKFKFTGQIKELEIIPWEEGELGVAFKFEDGTEGAQKVGYHANCFFVKVLSATVPELAKRLISVQNQVNRLKKRRGK